MEIFLPSAGVTGARVVQLWKFEEREIVKTLISTLEIAFAKKMP